MIIIQIICAHKVPPTIERLSRLAQEVGIEKTGMPGEFLSNIYMGSDVKHKWRCGMCKEIFDKTVNKVKNRRSWCPYCSQGYYEKICRGFIERIYSFLCKKRIYFPQTHLDQIVISVSGRESLKNYNPRNIGFDITQMHLDGFNYGLMVGFERQGKQHYIRVPEWQKVDRDFERQIDIDNFKQRFSELNNILLIVIGFELINGVWQRIEPEDMQDYIIKQIEEKTNKKLPPIPKFNYKVFLKEDLQDEIIYRKRLGEKQGFHYLTDFQRRILQELSKKSLFASDLHKMTHLEDIKSLKWTIRDLYQKGYLERKTAFNPSTLAHNKKQFQYHINKLGKELLDLSSN